MSAQKIQLQPESSGPKVQTYENSISGQTVNAQAVAIVGTDGVARSDAQFSIPRYDHIAFTYFGSTNNVQTQVFKVGGSGGTTVATLTYTYVSGGAADDDDIATVTLT